MEEDIRCPNCNESCEPGTEECPNCQTLLSGHSDRSHSDGDEISDLDASKEGTKQRYDPTNPLTRYSDKVPIEPVVTNLLKPQPYSNKIFLSSDEQNNISQLKSLTNGETRPQRIRRSRRVWSDKIIRFAIGLALIVSAIIPLFFGKPYHMSPPDDIRASSFSQHIFSLPVDAPILIAFDYQPGYSGELDPSTRIVLEQVMARNAYVTFLSTSPTGVLLAERVLHQAEENSARQYDSPANYINLGFIPAGEVGLSSLVSDLHSTVQQGINGESAWHLPQLQHVENISDFSLLIVVTDSIDNARSWVEQVNPSLYDTPFLMITSSQIEAIILPYYNATPPQIDGVISGLAGGVSYQSYTGRIDISNTTWASFSLSVLVSAGIILTGAIVSTFKASEDSDDHSMKGTDL